MRPADTRDPVTVDGPRPPGRAPSRGRLRHVVAAWILVATWGWAGESATPPGTVGPVPQALRDDWKIAPSYKKHLDVGGMAILSSDRVHDQALIEARYIIVSMIGHRPDLLAAIGRHQVRLAIMAPDEFTTDVPEHSSLRPREYWDERARGLGAQPGNPCFSCGEENLLGFPGDPYAAENILVHEFAHVIHQCGLDTVDPGFDGRLEAAFAAAQAMGLWQGKYAGTNRAEYWAEGVQSWFDDNRQDDHDHNHVHLRSQLKDYDPRLAALCAEVFGDGDWRYVRPERRVPPAAYLADGALAGATPFSWDELHRPGGQGEGSGAALPVA